MGLTILGEFAVKSRLKLETIPGHKPEEEVLEGETETSFSGIAVDPNLYWTTTEFGEFVNRSHYTLQLWRSTGKGPPYIKIGNRVLYNAIKAIAWMESHEITSTSAGSVAKSLDVSASEPEEETQDPSKNRRFDQRRGVWVVTGDTS